MNFKNIDLILTITIANFLSISISMFLMAFVYWLAGGFFDERLLNKNS